MDNLYQLYKPQDLSRIAADSPRQNVSLACCVCVAISVRELSTFCQLQLAIPSISFARNWILMELLVRLLVRSSSKNPKMHGCLDYVHDLPLILPQYCIALLIYNIWRPWELT